MAADHTCDCKANRNILRRRLEMELAERKPIIDGLERKGLIGPADDNDEVVPIIMASRL